MDYMWLFLAGLTEIGWMVGLKFSDGFTHLWWSVVTVACLGLSLFLLALAIRSIPMGTAYAIWTGIGAAGITVVGICFFGELRTALRLTCILLVLLGVAGLKISS